MNAKRLNAGDQACASGGKEDPDASRGNHTKLAKVIPKCKNTLKKDESRNVLSICKLGKLSHSR